MFIRQCQRVVKGKREAYWALVESYRTVRGPRQRVVAWLGRLDEAGRLGVQRAAEAPGAEAAGHSGATSARQTTLFEGEPSTPEPRWVEVNAAGVRVENCRQFGGPWLALELIRRLQLDEFLQQAMPEGREAGLGDEPRRVLDELAEIRSMDVVLPTRDGIEIRQRCVARPTEHQQILLDRLQLRLPYRPTATGLHQ